MKNIVFIVDGYYPNFSAVGLCISNLVEEMSSSNNITIITKKSYNTQQNTSVNKSYIRYVNTIDNYLRNRIAKKLKTTRGLKRKLLLIERIAVKSYGYLCALIKKRNLKNQDTKAFLKELEKIDTKIDVIIPACLPFESIMAAIQFKSNCLYEIKIVPFLFDKFSANSILHRTIFNRNKKFQKHLLLERQMFENCDKLFYVESGTQHLQEYFPKFEDKFCPVEHPLLKRVISNETIIYDCKRINIAYTGALYKKIRSPLYALKLFSRLIEKDRRILLHFYINGDCNSIVDSFCEKYPDNIINHGSVSTGFAKAAIINAQLLLSIGNSDITQLPSKIFEYISTGNPILHFYTDSKDQVIKILNQYSGSYCIKSDESSIKQEEKVRKTLTNFGNKIDFNEVEKIFYNATPKFIANKIMELL